MSIETVRVTKKGRDQLITLKRRTGIENWNILCRWAFCVSLAEHSQPSSDIIKGDYQIEMTWRTFGGEYSDIYLALLKHRCKIDGLEINDDVLSTQFKLHLHRGIGYLAGNKGIGSIADLIALVAPSKKSM